MSLGFRYIADGKWTYYGGVGYDSDPGQVETRIAILPADRQIRVAGGFTYDLSDTSQIGTTLTYVDLGKAKTKVQTPGGLYSGEFDTNELYILGVNYSWR